MALVTCRQLKAARALAGWTQKDLGREIGVDERQIRFWEKRIPTNPRKRQRLEHAFADVGIDLISSPTVGVSMSARHA